MKLISAPQSAECRPLPFYLAMEEYLATQEGAGEWVMVWGVGPTVIVGRNQDAAAEVRLDLCRAEGVEVYRRRSGGGAVYADRDNVMISFIVDVEGDVDAAFRRCSGLLAGALRQMGVEAEPTGRNDIEVGGRKVSGGAFHLVGRRGVAHFTMLFDADASAMERLLTPPADKLARHGVASVKARVATLRPLLPGLTAQTLAGALAERLTTERGELSHAEAAAIAATAEAEYPDLAMQQPSKQSINLKSNDKKHE